ncbi:hypothetical protein [Brevibacillus migulae]|uniref:hypothetical protein n=1 Tax=Brevibacillus migulae TaxID=1644114 RepID=UPI00106EAE9A|nr:hypothetical protein [Brevibacillus migulae]
MLNRRYGTRMYNDSGIKQGSAIFYGFFGTTFKANGKLAASCSFNMRITLGAKPTAVKVGSTSLPMTAEMTANPVRLRFGEGVNYPFSVVMNIEPNAIMSGQSNLPISMNMAANPFLFHWGKQTDPYLEQWQDEPNPGSIWRDVNQQQKDWRSN